MAALENCGVSPRSGIAYRQTCGFSRTHTIWSRMVAGDRDNLMKRHYSKVYVELPDGPADPPFAVVTIDCMDCGKSELKIHVQHLGTVLRTLSHTIETLYNDTNDTGHSEAMSPFFVPSTEENKKKVREYLDREFPGWVVGRKAKAGRA